MPRGIPACGRRKPVERPPLPSDRWQAYLLLKSQGFTVPEMAVRFGVTPSALYQWLRRKRGDCSCGAVGRVEYDGLCEDCWADSLVSEQSATICGQPVYDHDSPYDQRTDRHRGARSRKGET